MENITILEGYMLESLPVTTLKKLSTTVNIGEEAIAEDLTSHSQQLCEAAGTSCFYIYFSCQCCYR